VSAPSTVLVLDAQANSPAHKYLDAPDRLVVVTDSVALARHALSTMSVAVFVCDLAAQADFKSLATIAQVASPNVRILFTGAKPAETKARQILQAANARGSFFGAQEAQRLMTEGGSIVFISSCHAKKAVPGRALYTISKAAIGGMTRSLAVELGCLGIRVNAILAGAVRTDRWDGLSDEEVEKRRSRWPVGQESTPDQVAAAVAFLCSDAAGTISGAEIPIDSGIGACLLAYNKNWIQNDPYNVKYWEKKDG
jgi:NAD(P)-dependent dehydrogenase (short-subunit alcohol dehydrogenase family)